MRHTVQGMGCSLFFPPTAIRSGAPKSLVFPSLTPSAHAGKRVAIGAPAQWVFFSLVCMVKKFCARNDLKRTETFVQPDSGAI
ncbi:MAG: hypothetical protein WAW73_22685 [Rhodoferax sp.]